MIKLNNGDFCREAFVKLGIKQISLPCIMQWNGLYKSSGDMDTPISLLEGFRHCGRRSKIDNELRIWIKELDVDERHLEPHWIYLYLCDQLELIADAMGQCVF